MHFLEMWYPEYQKKYPGIATYLDQLKKRHPEGMKEPWKYVDGWHAARMLAGAIRGAIEKNGWPIKGEDVKNAMDELKDFDMEGTQPNLTMNKGVDNRGNKMAKSF